MNAATDEPRRGHPEKAAVMNENEFSGQSDAHEAPGAANTAEGTESAFGTVYTNEQVAATSRPKKAKRRRSIAIITAVSVLATGGAGAGIVAAVTFASSYSNSSTTTTAQGSTSQGTTTQGGTSLGGGSTSGGSTSGGSSSGGSTYGYGGGTTDGSDSTGTSTSTVDSTTATATQSSGVVIIDTVLKYAGGEAAGTGIVLTSNGEILTNNHVVEGATSITVTIPSTGKTYKATVVGTDSTDDVAVIQLTGASGLAVASIDTTAVTTGDDVTGVGNAEGTGTLTAADGTVTALDQTITVADEVTGASKSLKGLIETDADIVSGDSGGPLLDSDGDVVGIDTAASSGSTDITGYAIPIATAISIATKIEDGVESTTITQGYPAFLGVELATTSTDITSSTSGAAIAGVIDDTPAATAGIAAGDTITKVDGKTIDSATELSTAIAAKDTGDSVTLTWVTSTGTTQTATVTLIAGPAA
jgi:S1-C subfamily serine protease